MSMMTNHWPTERAAWIDDHRGFSGENNGRAARRASLLRITAHRQARDETSARRNAAAPIEAPPMRQRSGDDPLDYVLGVAAAAAAIAPPVLALGSAWLFESPGWAVAWLSAGVLGWGVGFAGSRILADAAGSLGGAPSSRWGFLGAVLPALATVALVGWLPAVALVTAGLAAGWIALGAQLRVWGFDADTLPRPRAALWASAGWLCSLLRLEPNSGAEWSK